MDANLSPTDYTCLDARGCFVILTAFTIYVWVGKAVPSHLRDQYVGAAITLRKRLATYEGVAIVDGDERDIIEQGTETDDFWSAVRGPGPISDAISFYNSDYDK